MGTPNQPPLPPLPPQPQQPQQGLAPRTNMRFWIWVYNASTGTWDQRHTGIDGDTYSDQWLSDFGNFVQSWQTWAQPMEYVLILPNPAYTP